MTEQDLDEVTTEEVQEEVKVEETPPPVVEPEPVKVEPIQVKPTNKSATFLHIEERLNDYIEKMQPGKGHPENVGPTLQEGLYRTILTILRIETEEFNTLFSYLLSVVNANRSTVFHEKYAMRYHNKLKLSNQERKCFERIMNLLLTTCNPSTRAQFKKQVDIPATMATFKDQKMSQRVLAFYEGL